MLINDDDDDDHHHHHPSTDGIMTTPHHGSIPGRGKRFF
jgi:hypothetical protein